MKVYVSNQEISLIFYFVTFNFGYGLTISQEHNFFHNIFHQKYMIYPISPLLHLPQHKSAH